MGSKKEIKEKFFRRGLKALNTFTEKQILYYYCPICARPFPKEALDNKELTLEHIPPEAQGGKGIALTCNICNNKAGHTVDAAVTNRNLLSNLHEALSTKQGNYEGRTKFNFAKNELESVNFDLSIKDSALRICLVEESNRPDCSENLIEFFKKQASLPDEERTPIPFTTRTRYHVWHSKVGDLRSAFLVCFAAFGYNYVFNETLGEVRNQIINYDDEIIDNFWWKLGPEEESGHRLYIINKPFNAILCQIGKVKILLPWMNSPENFYTFLSNKYSNSGHEVFEGNQISWSYCQMLCLEV